MCCFRVFSSPRRFRRCGGTLATGALVVVGSILTAPTAAFAVSSTYQVTVQTGGLNGLGVFGLDFLLQNGAVTNPLQATVRNFRMTGGTWAGSGGATAGSEPVGGNLGTSLLLATTNGDEFSEFTQDFRVSSSSASLTFDVSLSASTTQASSFDPDFFSFSILDDTKTPISTNAPNGTASLAFAAFDRSSPVVQAFRADSPLVTVQAAAAPEPNSMALLWPAVGLCGAAFVLQRQQGRRKAAIRMKTPSFVLK